MQQDDRIYVAGHSGLVGSAFLRKLKLNGYHRIITRTHAELDLANQVETAKFFSDEKPEIVILAAAKVGGVRANSNCPAEFIHQNLAIQSNVIHQCYLHGVRRLLVLGSSCIYPKASSQPISEDQLMTGPLEPTNSSYAVAKIAGIEMCWAYNRQYGTRFIPVMPCNLYGPDDNFDLLNSHVLPAMIRKFHLAKLAAQQAWPEILKDEARFGPIQMEIKQAIGLDPRSNTPVAGVSPKVVLWGTGQPRREFLMSDDMADACITVMQKPWKEFEVIHKDPQTLLLNIGAGRDLTIMALASLISRIVGYEGPIHWDKRMPDGVKCKLLDVSRLNKLGWQSQIALEQGIKKTYQWYLEAA